MKSKQLSANGLSLFAAALCLLLSGPEWCVGETLCRYTTAGCTGQGVCETVNAQDGTCTPAEQGTFATFAQSGAGQYALNIFMDPGCTRRALNVPLAAGQCVHVPFSSTYVRVTAPGEDGGAAGTSPLDGIVNLGGLAGGAGGTGAPGGGVGGGMGGGMGGGITDMLGQAAMQAIMGNVMGGLGF